MDILSNWIKMLEWICDLIPSWTVSTYGDSWLTAISMQLNAMKKSMEIYEIES